MLQSIKKMTFVLLACLALFASVVFFALPPIMENVLQSYVTDDSGRELQIERVTINPFTMTFDLLNTKYVDHSLSTLLDIPRVHVNFSIIGLLQQTIQFDDISIVRPRLNLRYPTESDSLLTQLVTDTLNREAISTSMSRLIVNAITIVNGSIELVDGTGLEEVTTRFEQIAFRGGNLIIHDLSANPAQRAVFDASMSINQSGRFQGRGWFEIGNQAAQFDVVLNDLDLQPFNRYLEKITPFVLNSAELTSEFQVLFEDGVMLIEGDIDTADVAMLDADAGKQALTLDNMTASGVKITTNPLNVSVENVALDQFYINTELDAGGRLNLAGWFDTAEVFPDGRVLTVSINRLELDGGVIDLTDFTLSPILQMHANQLTGTISRLQLECMFVQSAGMSTGWPAQSGMSTSRQQHEICRLNPRYPVLFSFQGDINNSGRGELVGRVRQGLSGRLSEVSVNLRDMDTAMLTPYSAGYLGRHIAAGTFDSDLEYSISNGTFDGRHRVRLSNIVLGESVESADAVALPLDLAVALLQDNDGQINLIMPFSGKLDEETGLDIRTAAVTAITDGIAGIVDAPFNVLGELAGIDGNVLRLGPFESGSAAITPEVLDTLIALSEGLKQRPLLGLGIVGRYDPELDRDALALQQIRLHVSLAAGIGAPGVTAESIDFSDPRIQEVLDEFALARLGANAEQTGTDTEGHYKNVFTALVREEEVADSALESLARYRRQSVIGRLALLGISDDRLVSADPAPGYKPDSSDALVELELIPFH